MEYSIIYAHNACVFFGVSPNTRHTGTGSSLDQGRTDVCTHRMITT